MPAWSRLRQQGRLQHRSTCVTRMPVSVRRHSNLRVTPSTQGAILLGQIMRGMQPLDPNRPRTLLALPPSVTIRDATRNAFAAIPAATADAASRSLAFTQQTLTSATVKARGALASAHERWPQALKNAARSAWQSVWSPGIWAWVLLTGLTMLLFAAVGVRHLQARTLEPGAYSQQVCSVSTANMKAVNRTCECISTCPPCPSWSWHFAVARRPLVSAGVS